MKANLLFILLPLFCTGQSLVMEVNQLFAKKEYVKAQAMLTEYMSDHPDDLEAVELLGDAYGHQRNWDKAVMHYRELVKANPGHANYHYKLGGALGMKALTVRKIRALPLVGDIKNSFLTAARLDPDHIDTRWALVELYMQLPGILGGSHKKALMYADELMNLSAVDGFLAKGYVYEYDRQPELAEFNYKKAVEIGGSVTCFEKLSNFYNNHKMPDKAITNMEEAYEKHNLNALHYQIGKVAADYNIHLEKGERCLKAYISNYSARDGVPVEWAYFRLAQIYKHKSDKKMAMHWIGKALEKRPDFKQALEERSTIQKI